MLTKVLIALAIASLGTAASADPPDTSKTDTIVMQSPDESAPDTPIDCAPAIMSDTLTSTVLDECPSDVCVCLDLGPAEVARRTPIKRTDHAQTRIVRASLTLSPLPTYSLPNGSIPHRDLQRRPDTSI